jgi:DNA-binding CsgD family transcriptional regulator
VSATGEAPPRSIAARRDQAAELYRSGLSERQVAGRLGVSVTTIHFDLVARDEPRREQLAGFRRPPTPEQLRALQAGNADFWASVERLKAERGLIGMAELRERLRIAGLPRSDRAILGYAHRGWIEPVPGLPFAKPWLWTETAVDELTTRLQHPYRDGRQTRFNDPHWRGSWIQARHGLRAARLAWSQAVKSLAAAKGTIVGRPPGSGRVLTPELQQLIQAGRAAGRSNRAIARGLHVSEATVRRFKPAS